MSRPTGFMEYPRELGGDRLPSIRTLDYFEMHLDLPEEKLRTQAARCMSCGIPFCHTGQLVSGMAKRLPDPQSHSRVERSCLSRPLEGSVGPPAQNEQFSRIHRTRLSRAVRGFVCAGNEQSARHDQEHRGHAIIDRGWAERLGHDRNRPQKRTGKKVAVVGSPVRQDSSAAAQLNKAGHLVTVFERADRPGGLLMYGIPNMKLDKQQVVLRRVELVGRRRRHVRLQRGGRKELIRPRNC